MASIDGGKALHHGGQAVAGIDGSMLGSQGLWIVPGQGCKGAQSPCSGFNVAMLHQAAIGHTLQHLFIGRIRPGYGLLFVLFLARNSETFGEILMDIFLPQMAECRHGMV